MFPILLFTSLPLGLFLVWASIALIRQRWVYLLVGDTYLPGKPSVAMLPLGIFLVGVTFADALLGLPQPLSGLIGLVLLACMAAGLLGCLYVPRFLQPSWMKKSDERLKNGTEDYSMKYGPYRADDRPTDRRQLWRNFRVTCNKFMMENLPLRHPVNGQ